MSQILKVGVVGCGEAAQILHLPTLKELRDKFAVTALCDVSQKVVDGVGQDLPGAARYTDASKLLADPNVDIVLLTNPNAYHASMAIEAMENGKHALIEKPMCMTLREADELAEVQARTGMVVQIGYMRRHAPAFEEAAAMIAPLRDKISYARVRDILPMNSAFIDATTPVIRGDDIPQSVIDETKARSDALMMEAIGTTEMPAARVYFLLLGLSSHDLSVMREMLGMPKSVEYAAIRNGGMFITATFDYGDFLCHFETAFDQIARFDANIEVYTPEKVVRVDYDTPYIRHQPARLSTIEANTRHGVTYSTGHSTRGDAFVIEWQRFYEAITEGKTPKTTIADARQDLELFQQIMEKCGGI